MLRTILVILSCLLLAAHCSRIGLDVLLPIPLLAPLLLLVRRRWAVRAVQVALLLGALEWIRATVGYVQARQAAGEPWLRLLIILTAAAVLSALAAWLLEKRARAWR